MGHKALTWDALGSRIRVARESAGLTQEVVAKRANMLRPAYVKLEAGQRKCSTLEIALIAEALGVSVGQLVLGTGEDWSGGPPAWLRELWTVVEFAVQDESISKSRAKELRRMVHRGSGFQPPELP